MVGICDKIIMCVFDTHLVSARCGVWMHRANVWAENRLIKLELIHQLYEG